MPQPRKYDWDLIESEVLRCESPLDYKVIEEKYGVPRKQLYQRAYNYKWKERHEEFLLQLNRRRDREKIDQLMSTYSKLDGAILRIAEALLQQIQRILVNAQNSEPMRTHEVKNLVESTARLTDMLETHRGDTANALKELIVDGIIPGDIVPQILDIMERSNESLSIELSKAFTGRIPD